MKYETKLSLQIFLLGSIILLIGYYIAYRYSYITIVNSELEYTNSLVDELSANFEQRLLEKIKTNKTLSTTPILKNKLIESNTAYGNYSENERENIINLNNNKWIAIEDENDPFILEYTNNDIAQYLKEHQQNFDGEYGEIFLTNKYGVLIASTSKLTTMAHAHKYWWQGAYENGNGAIFLDDRGYDESVGGYVLGISIPIKEDGEIIGILKVNLNILNSIGEMLSGSNNKLVGEFKLVRSGGEIIYDNKNDPLSNRIPDVLYDKIQIGDNTSFIFTDSIEDRMVGLSEITITSTDIGDFRFGGSFESLDHVKGNSGESWYVINCRSLDTIVKPLKSYTYTILAFGFLLILLMAIVAFIIGKITVKPLKHLIVQSKKIAKSDFSSRIEVSRKDEIGQLGEAFNSMTDELERNTTSIKNLESEISQRHNVEQELKLQNEEYTILNREYKTINEELIVAKDNAEESDRLKSAFLANMSHEIRTPMNGILGFSDLLKNPELSGEKQQKYIRIIERGGKRLLNIINDIISISKIESGLLELNLKDSNINEQIEYLYTFFKPEVEAKGLQFSFKNDLPLNDANLKTDIEKVYAILTNLIKNAIKYSVRGSIQFGYRYKKNSSTAELEFYVKDNGIGIPQNRQKAIFERFIQADIADKMARQGAGLGLSISKAYVEMLGGKIWVQSEVGIGTVFYFTLPFHIKPEEKLSLKNTVLYNKDEIQIRDLKILIAEDDETSQMLISLIVEDFCLEVLKAGTGKEAVDICRENPDINLILMDIQMPELNGYDATRQIRKFNKEVVIIAQTAFGLAGDQDKSIAAGCNEYITKPIITKKLLALITKYFKK